MTMQDFNAAVIEEFRAYNKDRRRIAGRRPLTAIEIKEMIEEGRP